MTTPSFIPPTPITASSPDAIVAAMREWSLGPLLADLDGAMHTSEHALAAAEAHDSPIAIAHALLVLGGAHAFLGNLDLAEAHLTRALDIFITLDHTWGIASTTIRMNLVWSGRGNYQLGNDRLMAILPMTQALDDLGLHFSLLNDLGATYRGLDALVLAITYALEAHRIAGKHGDPIFQIVSRFNLGGLHHELHDLRRATALYEDVLAIIEKHPHYARFAMFSEHNLGEISLQRKHYDAAITWYGQAIDHGGVYANEEVLVESLIGSARAHHMIGEDSTAAHLFTEALAILNQAEYGNDATHALTTWRLESLRGAWTWATVHALREVLASPVAVRAQIRIDILKALAESTTRLGDLVAANGYLRDALDEQERYWRRVAIQQAHMAMQAFQTNEARQDAEHARQEHETIGRAMQEIAQRNAHNEALVGELQVRSAALDRLVREDSLTGTANRRAFDELLRSDAMRHGHAQTIVLTDIDDFKQINDQHSHLIGDRVLVATANILKQIYRDSGIIARFGGDEFVIVMHNVQPDDAMLLAQRLRSAMRAYPWRAIASGLTVTLSIGVVTLTETETADIDDAESLLALVDQRLYAAKRAGKNRIVGPALMPDSEQP